MARSGRVLTVLVLSVSLFAVAGVGAFRSLRAQAPAPPQITAPDPDMLLAPAAAGLGATIAGLQRRLTEAPSDWKSFAWLGLAYVQEARTTADPTYYPKAQEALEASIRLRPRRNEEALVGLAALALARHDFAGALRYGERARALNPYDGNVYGVIGDAQLELGRYADAFDTFQTMVDTLPDLSSYARVSYARELQGDVAGALRAMQVAREVAGTPADVAWASFQIGELYFNSGRSGEAREAYRIGLRADPNYVPNEAGLARVAWSAGDRDEAIALYERVVLRYPAPEHVIALGDLYAAVGDRERARQQYALVRAEAALFRANGVNVDLELALFDADHGDAIAALAAARAEWRRRHSVHVADAYAWALYTSGRNARAATFARKAMALGTRSALFFFHAGMIELRLGHRGAARTLLARAIETNPTFSVRHAPEAERALSRLGGGR